MNDETIKVEILEIRDKSIYVSLYGYKHFIPRSQIQKMHITGKTADITLPDWLIDKLLAASTQDER